MQTDLWREPIATLGQDRGNLRQLLQIQVKRLQRREPRDEQELLFRCVLLFSSRIFCGGDLKNTRYVIFLDSAFSILKGFASGSNADIARLPAHVRFTPDGGHPAAGHRCPLSANRLTYHCEKTPLFDYFGGAGAQSLNQASHQMRSKYLCSPVRTNSLFWLWMVAAITTTPVVRCRLSAVMVSVA